MVKEEPYTNNVGYSERADVPIEPRLSEQWFLKYPSVEKSRACVAQERSATVPVAASGVPPDATSRAAIPSGGTPNGADETSALPGKMQFHPQRWAKVYDHWMEGIKDWCISRQLWWGHRIPVWKEGANSFSLAQTRGIDLESFLNQLTQEDSRIVYHRHPTGETAGLMYRFHRYVAVVPGREDIIKKLEEFGFTQDPDVLDTWFSSWLWPFATMGWPEQTDTLKKFYPTTDLVTGPDIIFFWVARMIMAGYEFMGDMPFKNVYFTGIIRDKQGRKMSKSLGNSPDPLDLIAKFGADALRFGVMRSAPLGQDVLFDEQQVELGRNFCNKLWNACRFRQMQEGDVEGEINPLLLASDDKWILLKLDLAITELTDALANYKFNEAAQILYRFFWSEYCDWYLETTKSAMSGGDAAVKANTLAVIDFVLSNMLRLFHPFMPFITEELWHGMGYHEELPAGQGGVTIMFAHWPKPLGRDFFAHYKLDDQTLKFVETRNQLITQGRNLRQSGNIPASKRVKFILTPSGDLPAHDVAAIRQLLNAESLELNRDYQPPKGTPSLHSDLGTLYLPLAGLIDVEAEKARLIKELAKNQAEIAKVEQKLNNPAFTQKVPPAVLEEHKQRLIDWQSKRAQLQSAFDSLRG
jgi:valyl-tRNA synthetase